jgi:hypothetical protein
MVCLAPGARILVWHLCYTRGGRGIGGDDSGVHTRGQPALLTQGGKLDAGEVLPRFQREALNMPEEVHEFIIEKIREHLFIRHDVKSKRRQVRREDWQKRGPGDSPDPAAR